MASTNYITSADLNALVSTGMSLSASVNTANDCIEYIAYSFGVEPSEIKTPIHYLLKEYAVSYAYKELYKNKIGTNNVALSEDKYLALFEFHNKELEKIRAFLTKEIITGDATTPNSVARTNILFRN